MASTEEIKVHLKQIDNRFVVEVIGKHVVISEILEQVEKILKENKNVGEVQICATESVQIDKDLKNQLWHGKNIAVVSKYINVSKPVRWDVSGKDNRHIFLRNAGTDENRNGLPGKDGYPGESGGNVRILTDRLEHAENFTIVSNGGKGSEGQDGGNGEDGRNGHGITNEEFEAVCPPTSWFFNNKTEAAIRQTIGTLRGISCQLKTQWARNRSSSTVHTQNVFDRLDEAPSSHDFFIEAVTKTGSEITFSFEITILGFQSFLLYKGSPGESGGSGGEAGLGGCGGYAGEIIVKSLTSQQKFNFNSINHEGDEGKSGLGGLFGKHGINGNDMAYTDYAPVILLNLEWPQYFGRDEKSKLSLEYSQHSNSYRIHCPYKLWTGSNMRYVSIQSSRIEQQKIQKYEERNNTRRTERQQHARAIRKNPILESALRANFSAYLNFVQNSQASARTQQHNSGSRTETATGPISNQTIRSDTTGEQLLETSMGEASPEQNELQNQIDERFVSDTTYTENETTEDEVLSIEQRQAFQAVVIRHVEFEHKVDQKPRSTATIQHTAKHESSRLTSIHSLNMDFKKQDSWSILPNHIFSREDLEHLFNEFEIIKKHSANQAITIDPSIQSIETLLIDKYKLATIEEIAKLLPLYADVQYDTELTAEEAIRYLIENPKEDSTKSHPVLGRLHPYLYENSEDQWEKLSKYCREELKNNCKFLPFVLETFILELGESPNVSTSIKNYYDRYKKDLENFEQYRNAPLNHLENKLKNTKYIEILHLWNKRETDENANLELKKGIAKDKILNNLYNEWLEKSKEQFTWDLAEDCCKDKQLCENFIEHIKGTGLSSKTYCETMARIFDIKLHLYEHNSDHEIVVKEIHNPSSTNTVYVLCKATKFVQLSIDTDPFRLHQERQHKDLLYKKVLSEIKLLQKRPEIDKYLQEKLFLKNHSPPAEVSFDVNYSSILTYFPADQRSTLNNELSKLTREYIGHEGILYFLQIRFSCEGNQISSKEVHYIISSILLYWNENRKEKYIFAWLIAAFPQRKWIDELVLLRLENYFKEQLKEKTKWREYLSKIQNKEVLVLLSEKSDQSKSLTTDHIETVLYLLSNISQGSFDLESRDLSEWPYVLKETYWYLKLEKICSMQECDDLSAASHYVRSIENTRGFAWVESLLNLFALKVTSEMLSCDTLTTILHCIHDETWNLVDTDLHDLKKDSLGEWMTKMQRRYAPIEEERNISQLVELIKCNANCSERVITNLSNIERSIIEINGSKYEIKKKLVNSFTDKDVITWSKNGNKKTDHKEMLAVINRAIELKRRFKLRDTQKLAVLALLANDRSTLAQVSTGEGKSLIVVAAAIMKALFGEKVDIVTSSSVLAKRDAENNNDIYSLFGITVSHNCSEDIEKRREAYVLCQVVYGDLGNFQRDYLLDRFYGKNILGDRDFANVIVDEVDSMLVDKGNNMLYLSHDIPWMDKLESVYLFIWQQIDSLKESDNEIDEDIKRIEEAVLRDLYGMITEKDIADIDVKLQSEERDRDRKEIWSRLVNAKIIDERGRLLLESLDGMDLSESFTPQFSTYTDRIYFSLQGIIGRKRLINVPNYLRSFVERHLKRWIKSAITAFYMNPGQNYVVDVDRTGTSSDRNANIIILDRDTGTDQANSQWDEALHQFLQLKHGCRLSMLTLKAVFISNVSYFKLYSHMYGLTGTLGSQTERDLLQEIHEVDFVTIPTSRTKQFREENPIICCDREEWYNSIRNHVVLMTEKNKRSALIICDTVKDAEDLYKHLRVNGATNIYCYVRDYEEFTEGTDDNKLDQGQVIIATNLAGRGTDIKITDALRKAGGLHVLLTYLPANKRIEEQAFGRAARCGDKGSGQLIIVHSEKCKLHVLKNERDEEEISRVSTIKSYYYNQIIAEEECFNKFRKRYQDMRKELKSQTVPDDVQDILLKSCLDKWAFWLDENYEDITFGESKRKDESFEKNLSQLMVSFESLSSERDEKKSYNAFNTDRWLPWVEGNPAQMIKLGTYLGRYESMPLTNSYNNSLKLLDDVIIREPYFSEAAHYNKAFIIAKKIDWNSKGDKEMKKNFKRELQEAAKLFQKHSDIATSTAGLISEMKQCDNEKVSRVDGYKEHKKHIANIYSTFTRSIDDILGHCITPESLQNEEIDHHSVENEFNKLLDESILKKPKIKRKNISNAIIRPIALDYGIPPDMLEKFLIKHSEDKTQKDARKTNEECFGFDVEKFEKELEKELFLKGREKFWEILIRKQILQDEVTYITVDKQYTTDEVTKLIQQLQQREDKERTIECKFDQIVLYEQNSEDCQDLLMFTKDALSTEQYDLLEKNNLLSINKRATVNVTDLEDVNLQLFDSISIDDLKDKANISEHDAKLILSELVEKQILQPSENSDSRSYALAINFDEMPGTQILSCPVYEPVVRGLLEVCFCYRLALQKIKRQLDEKKTPIRIELTSRPYRSLFFDLVDQKIIEQVKVNNKKLVNGLKNHENVKTSKLYEKLAQLRGTLKIPGKLMVRFNPLMHTFGEGNFGNIEEIRLFFVNGLDHVIHIERKKICSIIKIFFITVILGLIAVAKIAIGSIFRSKQLSLSGVNDLIYAAGVCRTQTFSWEHYKQHSIRNMLFLARDTYNGGLTLLGSWTSRIGCKLSVPRFEYAINRVITTAPALFRSGNSLFGTVMNIPRVSSTAERCLQTLCKAIEQEFISKIMKTSDDYNMSCSLEKYSDVLRYANASDTINMVIMNVFNERFISEKYLPIATKIANIVTAGITNDITQLNITGNVRQDIASLCNPTTRIEQITDWSEISNASYDALESLKSEIQSKLENLRRQNENQDTRTENNLPDSTDVWRKVHDQCKTMLYERAGRVISQHVATPIQMNCTHKITQHIENQINATS